MARRRPPPEEAPSLAAVEVALGLLSYRLRLDPDLPATRDHLERARAAVAALPADVRPPWQAKLDALIASEGFVRASRRPG